MESNLVRSLRDAAGYRLGFDLSARIDAAAKWQETQAQIMEAAADEIEKRDWKKFDRTRTPEGRYLVVKEDGGQRYIDVVCHVPELDSGLPPLPSIRGVTHYMELPALPEKA